MIRSIRGFAAGMFVMLSGVKLKSEVERSKFKNKKIKSIALRVLLLWDSVDNSLSNLCIKDLSVIDIVSAFATKPLT